jgi:phosphoenolpyruvate carboxylase
MIWPPITMATQHPDNATVPWWHKEAFITTQDEITELLTLFSELPIDEYMWDWEGKYVDEAVGEKLFSRAGEFFAKHPLGEELHLTYRIPSWEEGKSHRMARAFMNILSLADLARELHLPTPPVAEVFHPLTTSAAEPLAVHKAFRETAEYHRAVFHGSKKEEETFLKLLRVTPLVEDVDSLFSIEKIVEPYWKQLVREKAFDPERGQRIFLARSDPALNSGLVPAVLAARSALSAVHDVGQKMGFPVYPILGTGSLPFRGSVNPRYTHTFLDQYAGTATYCIQSAFRYDYPLPDVKRALANLRRDVPNRHAPKISAAERQGLRKLASMFEHTWKPTIEAIAPIINRVAQYVPARRERLLHIGLFGYSRGIGKVKLPRAIVFTGSLYSLGVPPELIATGRGLLAARKAKMLPLLERHYPALSEDLRHAGKFLNRENLELLGRELPMFKEIEKGIDAIEEVLGERFDSEKPQHVIHRNLTSNIFHRLRAAPDVDAITRDIVEAAVIRKSLG